MFRSFLPSITRDFKIEGQIKKNTGKTNKKNNKKGEDNVSYTNPHETITAAGCASIFL
jgi:hypothetical protein